MPEAGPPREALVLRFPPGGPDEIDKIRKEAKWIHRAHNRNREPPEPWYRLSVWADVERDGETEQQLKQRLVRAAGMAGIDLASQRNDRLWWTRAGRLYDVPLPFKKDHEPDEAPEHYSVDVGINAPTSVVVAFAQAFGPEEQRDDDTEDQGSDQPQPPDR